MWIESFHQCASSGPEHFIHHASQSSSDSKSGGHYTPFPVTERYAAGSQVHLPQFPRDMGRKDKSGGRAAQTLAMTVGASGGASYDAIVKQGENRDKWVASDHSALVPKLDSLKDEVRSGINQHVCLLSLPHGISIALHSFTYRLESELSTELPSASICENTSRPRLRSRTNHQRCVIRRPDLTRGRADRIILLQRSGANLLSPICCVVNLALVKFQRWIVVTLSALRHPWVYTPQMALPDDEELTKTAAETATALGLVVDKKIAAAQPKTLPKQPGAPTYIKYTPAQQGPQYNSGASQRIIKMQARLRFLPPCPSPGTLRHTVLSTQVT